MKYLENLDLKIIYDIATAVGIILFVYFVRKQISSLLTKLILRRIINIEEISSNIIRSLDNLVIIIGLFFAIDFMPFVGKTAITANNVVMSIIMVNIFHCLILMSDPIITFFYKGVIPGIKEWIVRILRLFILCIGLTSILNIWGIQVAPIIAGFGVLGAGVSFAAKDFFENVISGIVIMTERKFSVGDLVKIEGVGTGFVKAIRIRSTEVIQLDKSPIFVPNSKIASNSITNYTKMKTRIIETMVGLEYSTKMETLVKIRDRILDFINNSPNFNHSKTLSTYAKIFNLSDSSIDIKVQCFTNTNALKDFYETKEILNINIMRIVEEEKASFAFPSQSIYIEKS